MPENHEEEMIRSLKQSLQKFHDNNISVSDLIHQANIVFAEISRVSKNQEYINIALGVADLETDLRTDPELAGQRLKEAYDYFQIG